jgi:uncharacterized protein YjbI with pentapeptide repeats
MPYTNELVITSQTGLWSVANGLVFNNISVIPSIPLDAQLEVERSFMLDRDGNSIVDFLTDIFVKQSDKRKIYIIPNNRLTINSNTKIITAIDLPASGNVYDYVYYKTNAPQIPLVIKIPALIEGDFLIVRRKTVSNVPLVSWVSGSKLTSSQLNLQAQQILFLSQELLDRAYYISSSGYDLVYNLANNTVGTNQIVDSSVTTIKLNSQAVTTAKIADSNVTTAKIADNSVTTAKIADSNVTTAKIADSNVTTAKIADSNVTTTKIADNSVTTAKIADSNVTTAKIADSNVTTAKIADSNVTTAKIADSNVTTAKIADSNVTTAKIADNSVTTAKIADNSVTTAKIANSNVTTTKIADYNITPSKLINTSQAWSLLGTLALTDLATSASGDKVANKNYVLDRVSKLGIITKDSTVTNNTFNTLPIIPSDANDDVSLQNGGIWFNPFDGGLRVRVKNQWVRVTGTPLSDNNIATSDSVNNVSLVSDGIWFNPVDGGLRVRVKNQWVRVTGTPLNPTFSPPITKTNDFTVANNENVLINNKSGSACTVTLPVASSSTGRRILIKTIQAQSTISASNNVVPINGVAPGNAILSNVAGKYAEIISDGTNWIVMAAN